MGKAFVILFLTLVSGTAAAEWVLVTDSNAKGGSSVYVEPATVRRSGDMVKMWDIQSYKTAQVVIGIKYLSQKMLSEYDCKDRRMRPINFSWHADKMALGAMLYSDVDLPSKWDPVPAGSVDEALRKYACGTR